MPKINQKGLAPIMIIGLVLLGIVTAAATYFALNYTQPTEKAVNPQTQAPAPAPIETIEQVKAANEETLLNMEGVEKVEVGEKDGKPCVVVFTFKQTDELQDLRQDGLDGYEVVVLNNPVAQ